MRDMIERSIEWAMRQELLKPPPPKIGGLVHFTAAAFGLDPDLWVQYRWVPLYNNAEPALD